MVIQIKCYTNARVEEDMHANSVIYARHDMTIQVAISHEK